MATSTLTSEGQVTIPKEIRDRLGLKEGDRLAVELDDQGRVVLRPEPRAPLSRLPGLLRHLAPERPVTIEEMDAAIRADFADHLIGFHARTYGAQTVYTFDRTLSREEGFSLP